jgi:hypothetical protein
VIPSISYPGLITLDDLEQDNGCKLRSTITAESDSGLTDHDAALVGLDFGIE